MTKKGLAKKEDNKESGSTTRKATSGSNKSKDASVDNELRTGSLKDEVMRKAAVGSSKGEESAVKKSSKSKDDALDDDLKIGVLKNEVIRKAAGNKSKTEKSVAKEVRISNDVTIDADLTLGVLKNVVGGKVAGDKSMGKKVAKQSSKLKDSGADDGLTLGALKDEVMRTVSGAKSMGEKSAARKSKAGGGAKLGEKQDTETNMMEESIEDTPTPAKRKRGADGEIVQAFWLSPERSSSRLRPRKEVPAFRLVDLEDDDNDKIVGKRVKVYWSGSRKWFTGHIKAFDYDKGLHNILYEDGDCEMLDLRKEQFELEIMPTDCFKVRTKPSSEKKVKGLDVDKVSAETLKGDIEMVDAEKGAKESEPEEKTPTEIPVNEKKDPAVSNEGDLVAEMGGHVLPEKAEEMVINEVVEEPPNASHEKEQDGSKMDEEATQVIRLVSNSEVKELGSNNVEGGRKAVKDDFIKVENSKSVKKHVSSKKKAVPRAAKTRSSKPQNRKESKEEEDQDANMGGVSHDDEIKDKIMHVDINVDKSVEVNYQEEDGKIDSLAEEVHEEKGGMSAEGQHSTPDSNDEKKENDQVEKLTEIEDIMVPKDAKNRLSLSANPQGGKDDMEDLAANAEPSVLPDKVKEKVSSRKINVEGPENVDTVKNCEETEILLKAASEGDSDVSGNVLPTLPKNPEEEDPETLQGKLRVENSESEEAICVNLSGQKTEKAKKAKDNKNAESFAQYVRRERSQVQTQ